MVWTLPLSSFEEIIRERMQIESVEVVDIEYDEFSEELILSLEVDPTDREEGLTA